MPVRESFPGLDRAEHGLRTVRTDIAFGFVFVCLAPDTEFGPPPPVSSTWGKLAEELAPYRCEEMVPLGRITSDVWNVDWKIAMDNYLESYHVPIGHPGLYRMFTPDYEDQATVPGVARGLSWLRATRSSRWSEGLYQSLIGKAAGHLPENLRRCWRFESRYRRLPRPDGLLPGAAGGSREVHHSRRVIRLAGNRPGTARGTIFEQPHQHVRQQRRQVVVRARATRTRIEQLPARSLVAARGLHARIPQPAAGADTGISTPGSAPAFQPSLI
jgi:phenylpropionate dioxygenase-like ring-hydroxylating dioxygenase large terminal subunit